MRAAIAVALVVAAISPAHAATFPALAARPANALMTLRQGVTPLGDGAFAYRPATLPAGPRPLIVLLRGALGTARDPINNFRKLADTNGWLLLAPEAADGTWRVRQGRNGAADFGRDPPSIDAALSRMFAKAPIDPKRVVLLGFSDGASYALSLGTANPRLFRGIVALSPGYTAVPRRVDPSQRIFIAHGTDDQILPAANVRNAILPDLEAAGLKPRMRWFKGGHTIDRAAIEEALSHALGQQ